MLAPRLDGEDAAVVGDLDDVAHDLRRGLVVPAI